MKFLWILTLIIMPVTLLAQQNNQDTQEEVITIPRSMLTPDQLRRAELQEQMTQWGEYAGLGQEIGTAVNEGLGALTEHATSFADTDLGFYVMFLIGWKVVGTDFVQLIIGVPLLSFGTLFFIWMFCSNCRTRNICVKVTGTGKDKVKEYEVFEPSSDAQWAHIVIYGIFLGICTAILFA